MGANYFRFPDPIGRSKNEIIKAMSRAGFHVALEDFNLFLEKGPKGYYRNHPDSDANSGKFIRMPQGVLHRVNQSMDVLILKPVDKLVPAHIFGGVSARNCAMAMSKHKSAITRNFLKFDLKRFYEHVSLVDVEETLIRFGYKTAMAQKLAGFCCVPLSKKFTTDAPMVLARGFNASTRLAIWAKMSFFVELKNLVSNLLVGMDAEISVFVDDIVISFNSIEGANNSELFERVSSEVSELAIRHGLELNSEKTKFHEGEFDFEALGIAVYQNRIRPSRAIREKKKRALIAVKKGDQSCLPSLIGLKGYDRQIRRA